MDIIINKRTLYDDKTIKIDVDRRQYLDNFHNIKKLNDNILLQIVKNISSWKGSYINNATVDGTLYNIKIISKNGTKEYTFKNKFPANFKDFTEAIKEILNG